MTLAPGRTRPRIVDRTKASKTSRRHRRSIAGDGAGNDAVPSADSTRSTPAFLVRNPDLRFAARESEGKEDVAGSVGLQSIVP